MLMAFWEVWEPMLTFNTRFAIFKHLPEKQKNRNRRRGRSRGATASSASNQRAISNQLVHAGVRHYRPRPPRASRIASRREMQNFAERAPRPPSSSESTRFDEAVPLPPAARIAPHSERVTVV